MHRAALLAGPLGQPETALVELEGLRRSSRSATDELRVGAALVDLYDRRLRHAQAELKAEHLESP